LQCRRNLAVRVDGPLNGSTFARSPANGTALLVVENRSRSGKHVMSFILFLLFGLIVGALARLIVPGREPGGWVVSMLIGVVGSVVGGLLGRAVGFYREGETAGFLMALLGAVLLVAAYHAYAGRRAAA
jgi:uncharacterized membrane protein YeaQ/YmgE (transglycosylase-associated protein family)